MTLRRCRLELGGRKGEANVRQKPLSPSPQTSVMQVIEQKFQNGDSLPITLLLYPHFRKGEKDRRVPDFGASEHTGRLCKCLNGAFETGDRLFMVTLSGGDAPKEDCGGS